MFVYTTTSRLKNQCIFIYFLQFFSQLDVKFNYVKICGKVEYLKIPISVMQQELYFLYILA